MTILISFYLTFNIIQFAFNILLSGEDDIEQYAAYFDNYN